MFEKAAAYFHRTVVTDDVLKQLRQNDSHLHILSAAQIVKSYTDYLADNDIKILCDALVGNTQVNKLEFHGSDKHTKISDIGAGYIAQLLKHNSTITEIDFYNNNISDNGAKLIAHSIKKNKHSKIINVNFRFNKISDEGASAIVQIINDRAGMQIELQGNQISDAGAKAIAQFLEHSHFSPPSEDSEFKPYFIDLCDNQIGPEGAKVLYAVFFKKFFIARNYVNFSLEGNPVGDQGAKNITNLFTAAISSFSDNHFFSLNFINNGISSDGVKEIANIFGQIKTNQRIGIGLNGNKIGPEGAPAIAQLLSNTPAIYSLNLSENEIGFEGAQVIAQFLEHNDTMQYLHLNHCGFGDAEIILIAKSLEKHAKIETLGLHNYSNNGKVAYGQALIELLEKNSRIKKIGYYDDQVENRSAIEGLLERNNKNARTVAQEEGSQSTNSIWGALSAYNPVPASFRDYLTFIPFTQNLLSLPIQLITSVLPSRASPNSIASGELKTSSNSTATSTVATAQPSTAPLVVVQKNTDNYNLLNTFSNLIYAAGAEAYNVTSYMALSLYANGAENNNVTTPTIPAETIAQLIAMGLNISENMTLLSMLKTKQDSLSQSISAWEVQAKQNNIIRAELETIAQNPEVKWYYQMMKSILERTLMAAIVIASGEVASSTGIAGKLFDGLCTLAGIAFPTAAPALGFIKMSAGALGSTITYREMQRRLRWIELSEIPEFAAMLARRLALAQKAQIIAGTSRTEKSTFDRIKGQCSLLVEELKSGQTLSDGEKRAILDAKELFEYMLSHDKPDDMSLSGRTNLLVQQIVGGQYVYTLPTTENSVMQTNSGSTSSATSTIIPVATNTTASQHEIDTLRQEMSQLKAALESEKQSKHEQAQQLQTVHRTVQELQARQPLLSTQTFHNTDVVLGNGSQVLLQKQVQMGLNSSSAPATVLNYVYRRVVEHDNAFATLGARVEIMGEQITSLEQTKKDNGLPTWNRVEINNNNAAVVAEEQDDDGLISCRFM